MHERTRVNKAHVALLQESVRIEVEYGSNQKEVWQCTCSNTYITMRYATLFRKGVWRQCTNQKECVAVICISMHGVSTGLPRAFTSLCRFRCLVVSLQRSAHLGRFLSRSASIEAIRITFRPYLIICESKLVEHKGLRIGSALQKGNPMELISAKLRINYMCSSCPRMHYRTHSDYSKPYERKQRCN